MGTQTLSGAGLLKMFNKATDAVSKMTIKMNESDIVSSPVLPLLLQAYRLEALRYREISEIRDYLFKIIQFVLKNC